jgi:hypothetical protein
MPACTHLDYDCLLFNPPQNFKPKPHTHVFPSHVVLTVYRCISGMSPTIPSIRIFLLPPVNLCVAHFIADRFHIISKWWCPDLISLKGLNRWKNSLSGPHSPCHSGAWVDACANRHTHPSICKLVAHCVPLAGEGPHSVPADFDSGAEAGTSMPGATPLPTAVSLLAPL